MQLYYRLEYESLNFLSPQTASGEHQLLYEFAWSSIDRLKFQVCLFVNSFIHSAIYLLIHLLTYKRPSLSVKRAVKMKLF